MSKTYEELQGAKGKAGHFRPARHAASKLFASGAPRVFFDEHEFSLLDLSASGLGCWTPEGEWDGIETLNRRGVLRLVQHGKEIFRSRARHARCDLVNGRTIAGFALEGAGFDLDDVRRRNAAALASLFVDDAPDVSAEYKAHCADAMEFVGRLLNRIDVHVGRMGTDLAGAQIDEIAADIAATAAAPWRRILEAGNRLVIPLHADKGVRRQLKTYTERTVTRLLIGGESWARSYFKPQGYPGDYKIMNFMYDRSLNGPDVRSKVLHALGVIAGEPIVSRMKKLAEILIAHAAAENVGRAVEIMSIGSGPARELERLHADAPKGVKWRATLVDQEPDALEYALRNVRRTGADASVEVAPLNVSFKDMLMPSAMNADFHDKDVIYSSGLVDYLSPISAMRFVQRMLEFLRPGGLLVIGNVNDIASGTLWPMEYILDWTLYFRGEADMLAMASGVDKRAKVRVVPDDMAAIHFLVVQKPRA